MYARYVPPVKKSSSPQVEATTAPATKPPTRSAPVAAAPAVPQEVGGAGFAYSRYIPGSKPAAKPTASSGVQYFDDDEPEQPSSPPSKRKRQAEDEPPRDSPSPESKKSKKSKQDKNLKGKDGEESGRSTSKEDRKSKKKQKQLEQAKVEPNGDASLASPKTEIKSLSQSAQEVEVETKDDKDERKAEKKRKKSKDVENELPESRNKAETNDPDVPMTDAGDKAPPAPTTALDETSTETKSRKRKEKSKKDKSSEGDIVDKEDERHKLMLERKSKSLKLASEAPKVEGKEEDDIEPQHVHPLEPLPLPKLVSEDLTNATYETLPTWLTAPIRVTQDTRTPFSELRILPKAARILEEKGFPNAFAVQTAAIPLLLPTSKVRPGDLLISAATGSGKTLAYALPIVRDISQGVVTRLRALVVLPTRELVKQAQEVFELCAKAYEGGDRKRVRIGTAIGSQTLRSEQENLMECESRYDPEAYARIQEERRSAETADPLLDPGFEDSDPRLGTWEGQVNEFFSKADILICTPGRLVEHIEQTRGFDLDYVRWLVVDEADKLLAQSFQGWLDVLLEKFEKRKFTAREFPDMDMEGVRKVVLSATLTRDLSLLNQLHLSRPQLIILDGDSGAGAQVAEHTLPALLEESAVRVRDTALKPLYLLELLKGGHMQTSGADVKKPAETAESSSDSDSTSDSSSDSDSTSDSASDSDSDTETNKKSDLAKLPITLIFTKSNEAALRLSRLLSLIDESVTPQVSTLTSTTPTHIRRKTLRAFTTPSSPIRVIIASDLVARGIDLPKLDHVINYDLPPSAAGYVHRVGRTARAGRSGRAWTLLGDDESGWFWGKIAKGSLIHRAKKVGRTMIEDMDDEKVKRYEEAMAKLGQEALETRKR